MQTNRTGVCCAVLGGYVYAIGGRDRSGHIVNSCERFDGRVWSEAASLNECRVQAAAAVFLGKIYVIGGMRGDHAKTVEVFDPATNKWSFIDAALKNKKGCAACVFEGALYIIGGHNGSEFTSEVLKFDGKEWTQAPPLLSPRSVCGAAVFLSWRD